MSEVNQGQFDNAISDGITAVKMFAEWCGPCRLLDRELLPVIESYNGQVKLLAIDVEQCPGIATKYNIAALPTVILFKDGQETSRLIGSQMRGNLIENINALMPGQHSTSNDSQHNE